jgi:transcriptional regulator with GAF, ATPase, and Fis domain
METRQMINRKEVYGKVKEAIIEAHAAGQTYAEAAAKLGLRRDSLYTAAKRLGLPLKPSKHRK